MTIKIKCPSCNARNQLTPNQTNCRRCQIDLQLLYQIKAHSIKYRIAALQHIFSEEEMAQQATKQLLQAAKSLT